MQNKSYTFDDIQVIKTIFGLLQKRGEKIGSLAQDMQFYKKMNS